MSSSKRYNVATYPVHLAIRYANRQCKRYLRQPLERVLPDFAKNYMLLQDRCNNALNIPRYQMPVIEPRDMELFEEKIRKGHVDIFRPYAGIKELFPTELKPKEGEKWLTLGLRDGMIKDDVIKAEVKKIPAGKLLPLQSQIWLELLIKYIIDYGVPREGARVTQSTIIISKEYYILDGHHRYGQVMLASPRITMRCLYVPLSIGLLLKMGKSYGVAVGNPPNY